MAACCSAVASVPDRGRAAVHLRHLSLTDFRASRTLEMPFDDGHHLLLGRNGAGKTNLLEAIHVLGTGSSQRATRDAVLVRHGAAGFRVAGRFEGEAGAGCRIEVAWDARGGKRVLLDKEGGRASDLLATVKVVSFAPSDVELVRESGRVRRRFLDLLGCQLSPEYLQLLRDYQRALKQRNETLARSFVHARGHALAAAAREPWTERVVVLGADLALRRARLMDELQSSLAALTAGAFPGAGELRAEYAPGVSWNDEGASQALAKAIEASAAKDEAQGYTSAGPHTDDIDLQLDGRSLRRYGSLGQQQLAAMFLKLAQADLVRTTTGATPILLVDEMFAVLDRGAAEEFLGKVEGEGQIFLATAQEGWLGELRGRRFRVHHVDAGEVRSEAAAARSN